MQLRDLSVDARWARLRSVKKPKGRSARHRWVPLTALDDQERAVLVRFRRLRGTQVVGVDGVDLWGDTTRAAAISYRAYLKEVHRARVGFVPSDMSCEAHRVSTHTPRKSVATHLSLRGVPTNRPIFDPPYVYVSDVCESSLGSSFLARVLCISVSARPGPAAGLGGGRRQRPETRN